MAHLKMHKKLLKSLWLAENVAKIIAVIAPHRMGLRILGIGKVDALG